MVTGRKHESFLLGLMWTRAAFSHTVTLFSVFFFLQFRYRDTSGNWAFRANSWINVTNWPFKICFSVLHDGFPADYSPVLSAHSAATSDQERGGVCYKRDRWASATLHTEKRLDFVCFLNVVSCGQQHHEVECSFCFCISEHICVWVITQMPLDTPPPRLFCKYIIHTFFQFSLKDGK